MELRIRKGELPTTYQLVLFLFAVVVISTVAYVTSNGINGALDQALQRTIN